MLLAVENSLGPLALRARTARLLLAGVPTNKFPPDSRLISNRGWDSILALKRYYRGGVTSEHNIDSRFPHGAE